jgi:hypothetical protein
MQPRDQRGGGKDRVGAPENNGGLRDGGWSLTYYVREVQSLDQPLPEIWKITDDEAIRQGQTGDLGHYRREPDETIWEAIRRLGAWERPDGSLPIHELKVPPGHYFPRIARPIITSPAISAKKLRSCPRRPCVR